MKKTIYMFALVLMTLGVAMGCRDEKSTGEKVEDGIEEVGDELEEGAEEIEDEVDGD